MILPMKKILFIAIAITMAVLNSPAQADSSLVAPPHFKYLRNIYNPQTRTSNISYDYSGKWDFDGDHINDTLLFIGNGGVHVYFYPKIVLSSNKRTWSFPSVQLDMPYISGTMETIKKDLTQAAVQLFAGDFNGDSITDIYLNFDNPFGSIPKPWKLSGITQRRVILSINRGNISVSNY
jgi:hypothetical protein